MFNRLVRAASGPAVAEFNQLAELPPIAADVLKKALALEPARRYQRRAISRAISWATSPPAAPSSPTHGNVVPGASPRDPITSVRETHESGSGDESGAAA